MIFFCVSGHSRTRAFSKHHIELLQVSRHHHLLLEVSFSSFFIPGVHTVSSSSMISRSATPSNRFRNGSVKLGITQRTTSFVLLLATNVIYLRSVKCQRRMLKTFAQWYPKFCFKSKRQPKTAQMWKMLLLRSPRSLWWVDQFYVEQFVKIRFIVEPSKQCWRRNNRRN